MTKRFIGPYNQANENHAIHFILEFMIQSHNVTVSILRHKAALTSFLSIVALESNIHALLFPCLWAKIPREQNITCYAHVTIGNKHTGLTHVLTLLTITGTFVNSGWRSRSNPPPHPSRRLLRYAITQIYITQILHSYMTQVYDTSSSQIYIQLIWCWFTLLCSLRLWESHSCTCPVPEKTISIRPRF